MNIKQRYEISVDGAGGVFAIDHLYGTRRYAQFHEKNDVELRYEGVRLIVPVVLSVALGAAIAPPTWRILKPLEFSHGVVFIAVQRSVAVSDDGAMVLNQFSELAQMSLGWQLLPLLIDKSFEADGACLVRAALAALQARWRKPLLTSADGLRAALKIPHIDATLRAEIAAAASAEYEASDYGRRRLASFIEYYAENSLAEVAARAEIFAERKISGGQLADRVSDALNAKKPFSFVRVGEGEGCFLSYARYKSDRSRKNEVFGVCAKDIYKVWFDRNIHDSTEQELNAVTNLFWRAVLESDVIGIPTLERVIFEQAHFVSDIGRHGFSRGYVGVSEILSYLERGDQSGQLEGKQFADCDIARPLYEWQDWRQSLAITLPRLLKGRRGVTLVTCHSGLAASLQAMLDLQDVRTLSIPPERGRVKGEGHLEGDHYHDHFNRVCESLRRDTTPIVIVAAGFVGKAYCAVARESGGVAIDIGSLADYWVGINTRQKNAWSVPSPFAVT